MLAASQHPWEVRLMNKAQRRDDGCLVWIGYSHNGRYGSFKENGIRILCHVAAYVVNHGPVPAGMKVLHTCDTPRCIEGDHLFIGTQADNRRDMVIKGRGRAERGEDRYNAKLTDVIVADIRRRGNCEDFGALAKEFNTTYSRIWAIVNRRIWKHVE